MDKITCVETRKIKNNNAITDVIYNNFVYLTDFPELKHTKEDINEIFDSEGHLSYLVYFNNKLIGYLVGDFRLLPDNRYAYYISYLYVSKDHRKKKIGSHLMKNIITKCKKDGVKFITLTCDTNDKGVINFYRKIGFAKDPILGDRKRHMVYSLFL